MKRNVLLLVILLISIVSFGQSNYSRGFQKGYKEGFCYNDYNCISPVTPVAPVPSVNESYDSFTDGYNRGFIQGQSDKNKKTQKNSGFKSSSQKSINYAYKPSYSYNDLVRIMRTRERLLDEAVKAKDHEDWYSAINYAKKALQFSLTKEAKLFPYAVIVRSYYELGNYKLTKKYIRKLPDKHLRKVMMKRLENIK